MLASGVSVESLILVSLLPCLVVPCRMDGNVIPALEFGARPPRARSRQDGYDVHIDEDQVHRQRMKGEAARSSPAKFDGFIGMNEQQSTYTTQLGDDLSPPPRISNLTGRMAMQQYHFPRRRNEKGRRIHMWGEEVARNDVKSSIKTIKRRETVF
ncbi:hypothetical protein L210DRAFT_3629738 [Boletus edulis BED1]|uniref:Secreted protein n=1 Tax=Boletus edulis BED1 TaxID=1328754 RepID=A0AAD4GGT9_BOLED|nr:hypothetical protein L210DRAFT_3629738 [Boletus edulis BED1]